MFLDIKNHPTETSLSFVTNAVAGDSIQINSKSVFVKAGRDWYHNETSTYIEPIMINFLIRKNK